MNRKQRRQGKKDGLVPTEHLTQTEYSEKLKREATEIVKQQTSKVLDEKIQVRVNKILQETLECSMAAAILALKNEFKFGESRMKRFVGEYNSIFDRVLAGEEDLDRVKEVATSMGINLNVGGEKSGEPKTN